MCRTKQKLPIIINTKNLMHIAAITPGIFGVLLMYGINSYAAINHKNVEAHNIVLNIEYIPSDLNSATILIKTKGYSRYAIHKFEEPTGVALDLENSILSPKMCKYYHVKGNTVEEIRCVQLKRSPNIVRIYLSLNKAIPVKVEQGQNFIKLILSKNVSQNKTLKTKKKLCRAANKTQIPSKRTKKQSENDILVSLNFQKADIKTFLRGIAEVSNKNIVIDPDVTGEINIALPHPVPWKQALDIVLATNGLGKIMKGNIIRIAKLETIDKEKELVKLHI